MAKSGLKHIDVGAELTKTEWESEDSHELLHGSSFPGTPVERQLFYRDDEHKWYIYNASAWVWLGGGGGMSEHGNEYHNPDFEQQGVAATQIETHRTTAIHTQPQPAALHGNEDHDPDFAEASHSHAQLHDRQHGIATTADHTSAITAGKMVKADSNGLPAEATNTDAQVSDAVSKAHTQGTDSQFITKATLTEQGDLIYASAASTPARLEHGTAGQRLKTGGDAANPSWTDEIATLTFIIDGAGSAITTGQKGHLEVPFACTITGWTLMADQSGSIVIDVWKDTYANFPPTVADTITGTEKPTLSSAQKNQDLTLTTWTASVAAGDILAFNVDSAATVTRVTLSIRVKKT